MSGLEWGRGTQKSQNQRDHLFRKSLLDIAGFEQGRRHEPRNSGRLLKLETRK